MQHFWAKSHPHTFVPPSSDCWPFKLELLGYVHSKGNVWSQNVVTTTQLDKQIIPFQETYSLEQACGMQASVPSLQDKSDILLMNMLLPMCLRVGSGRKDVPRMRKSDIVYILNVILTSIHVGAPRIKTTTEANSTSVGTGAGGTGATRSGSVCEKKPRLSSCQIAFLGLKILCVCFDMELSTEWSRTVRAVQELGNRNEGGPPLWDFLEFVVTVRTSIFPMFCPLVAEKVREAVAKFMVLNSLIYFSLSLFLPDV